MEILQYITPAQPELFAMLARRFQDAVVKEGSYILVQGEAPVMLVAHLDTVHKEPVKTVCFSSDRNILMSPEGIGGDDRCGVYALCSVYEAAEYKPWLLFTCDEEVGCIGADDFAGDYFKKLIPFDLSFLKMVIEVDRKGKDDAVYYECDNREFEDYITSKGFVTAHGSVSDISYVAPALGVAAVNLSSGYYNAHTQHEYVNLAEIHTTIAKIQEIVDESMSDAVPAFEYVELCDDFDGREEYLRRLTSAKSDIEAIQSEIDDINDEVKEKLYPFENLSLKDRKTVNSIAERYYALSEYDRTKVYRSEDILKAKAKLDGELRSVIVGAFLTIAAAASVFFLGRGIYMRCHKKDRELTELAEKDK